MKKLQKPLALLLAALMAVTLLPVSVLAEDGADPSAETTAAEEDMWSALIAGDHVHEFEEKTVPGNCVTREKTVNVCKVCGLTRTLREGNYGDHGELTFVESIPGSCTQYPAEVYTCGVCGETVTEYDYNSSYGHGHRHADGAQPTSSTAPTCTQDGYDYYVCEVCGNSYSERIWRTGHSRAADDPGVTVAPTCGVPGYTEYVCTVCGETYRTNETYQSHEYETRPHDCGMPLCTVSTCKICGETDDNICFTRCGDNLTWRVADGTLTISGSGDMWSWSDDSRAPLPGWANYIAEFFYPMHYSRIVVEEGCTSLSLYFYGLALLSQEPVTEIVLPDTLRRIDPMALTGFTALESLTLPASLSSFGSYLDERLGTEDMPDLCAYNIPAVTFGNKDLPLKDGEFYFAAVKDAELSALQNLYMEMTFRLLTADGQTKTQLQEALAEYESTGYADGAEAYFEQLRAQTRANYEPTIRCEEQMLLYLEKVRANHDYDYRTELSLYGDEALSLLESYSAYMEEQGVNAWDALVAGRGETSEEEYFQARVAEHENTKNAYSAEMERQLAALEAQIEENRDAIETQFLYYEAGTSNLRYLINRMGEYESLEEIRSAYLALFAQKRQEYGGNAFIGGTVYGYSNARKWAEGMNAAYGTTYEFVSLCDHPECEEVGEKAPTCTEDGYTGDLVCALCGDVAEAGEVIPATGHTDENGDEICDVCGADTTLIFDLSTADGTRYVLTTDGTLTITGSGESVYDARIPGDRAVRKALYTNVLRIKNVVVSEGITGFAGIESETVNTTAPFENLELCPTLESMDYPSTYTGREISPYYAPRFTRATFRNKDREYFGESTLINKSGISCTEAEYCDAVAKMLAADAADPGAEAEAADAAYQAALAALGVSDMDDLMTDPASEIRSPFTVYGYSNARELVDLVHRYYPASDVRFVSLCPHTHTSVRNYPADCTHVGITGVTSCDDCGDLLDTGKVSPVLRHTDADADGKCDLCGADMIVGGSVSDTITWSLDMASGTLTLDGTGALPEYYDGRSDENGGDVPGNYVPWDDGIRNLYMTHLVIGAGIDSLGPSDPDSLLFPLLEDVTVLNPALSFGDIRIGYTMYSSEAARQEILLFVECAADCEQNETYDETYFALKEKTYLRMMNEGSADLRTLFSHEDYSHLYAYKIPGFTVCGPTESTARTYAEENGFLFRGLDCDHATTELRGQTAATCTVDGYTGDLVCAACGWVLEKGEVLPAGHTDENQDDVCDVCGADLTLLFDLTGADGTRYVLGRDGTLTISGSGESVSDTSLPADNAVHSALVDHTLDIKRIVIAEGIADFISRTDEEGRVFDHLISVLNGCVNLESISYPATYLHKMEIAPSYAPRFTEITVRNKDARMPGASAVQANYELTCTEAQYVDVLTRYLAAMRLMRNVPVGTTTSDPETAAAVRAYQDACAALGVSDFGELLQPCSPKSRSPFTVYGYGNAKQTVTKVNSYLNGNVRFVSLCTHTETEEISYPAACDRVGFTAGVVCKDCGEMLAEGAMLPILSHTDADGNHLCDACGAETLVSGSLSDTVTWTADLVSHTLTIDGAGALPTLVVNGDGAGEPWSDYFNNGAYWNVVLGAGITSLGENDAHTLGMVYLSGLTVLNPELSPADAKLGYTLFPGTSLPDILSLEEIGRSLDAEGIDNSYRELCMGAYQDLMRRLPQDVMDKMAAGTPDWSLDYKLADFTVRGYADSPAQAYAAENGFAFEALAAACEHQHTEWRGAVEKTCTADGYTGDLYCKDCGELLARGAAVPAGHDWEDWVYWDEESHYRYCAANSDHEEYAPHTWEKTDEIPATCAAKGEITYVCADCGEEKTEETEKLPHTPVEIPAVAPTCTKGGFTAGSKCAVCDTVLTAPQPVEKLGHTYAPTVIRAATCTVPGETLYTCSACGASYTEYPPVIPHTPVEIPAVDPTCTAEGSSAGSKCAVCDTVLTAPQPVEKLGHNYVPAVTAPTCTEKGYTTYTCSRCGDTYTGDEVPANDHVWDAGTVTEPSACNVSGEILYTCTVCGETRTAPAPFAAHTLEAVTAAEASCDAPGHIAHYRCAVCGALFLDAEGQQPAAEQDVVIPAAGHQPKTQMQPATCEEEGWTKVTCAVCGKLLYSRTEDPIGHDWGEWVYLDDDTHVRTCSHDDSHTQTQAHPWEKTGETPATCTAKGEETYFCAVCGEEKTEELARLPHTPVEIPAVSATCTADGLTAGSKCSVCGTVLKQQAVTEKLGHVYEPAVTRAATCELEGETLYTCSRCGDSYTEAIEKLAHTPEEIPAVPATCTKTGLTAGSKCSVCGEILTAQETVEKLAHTPEEIPAVPATCTKTGLTAGTKCSVCGEILTAQETVDKIAHTPEEIPAVPATCTKTGLTAGTKCSVCGEILTAQETVDKIAHTPKTEITKNPDCTVPGEMREFCEVCGEELSVTPIPVNDAHRWGGWTSDGEARHMRVCANNPDHVEYADHKWNAGKVTRKATCAEAGEKLFTCVLCKETKTEPIEKLAHTPEEIPAVPATCTAAGLTAGVRCAVCHEILTAQEATEKLAHTPETIPAVPATCTKTGLTAGSKCSVCGTVLTAQTVTEKIPHTPETVPAVEATCTKTGLTSGSKCAVCGEVLVPQTATPKKAHDYRAAVTRAPSCTETGVRTLTCTVCGDSYTETIPAAGHKMRAVAAKPAKCEEAGSRACYVCAACGKTFADAAGTQPLTAQEIAVPAAGHKTETKVTAPTCEEAGLTQTVCSVCGKLIDSRVELPTGHKWGKWTKADDNTHVRVCANDASHTDTAAHKWNAGKVTKKATCTAAGEKTFTCAQCRATKTEPIPATGHSFGEWTVTRDATIREAGEKTRYCADCDEKETEALPIVESVKTTDENTGISVAYTGEAYADESIHVVAERTYQGAKYMASSYGKVDFWDIKTLKGEKEVQPDAPVLVSIPLPEGYDPASIEIYHINSETGVREYVPGVKVENGMITFFAGGFSIYVVLDTRTLGEEFPETSFLLGDVDLSGDISAADARLALRRAVNLETFAETPASQQAADVDFSNSVTASDARSILRAAVNLEKPEDWKK